MTKKKTSMKKSTRGRGGKRCPVRVKLEDRLVEQETLLRRQGNNGGFYEDVMLYVKKQPLPGTRKRGRPRKCLQDVGRAMNSSTDVLYVPSVKEGSNQLTPLLTKCALRRYMRQRQKSKPVKCIPNTVVPLKRKPVMASLRMNQNEGLGDWPDDLKELLATWDYLPERYTKEVVKWLSTPIQSTGLPTVVRNAHTLASLEFHEMGTLPLEEECNLWLQEQSTTTVTSSTTVTSTVSVPTFESPQQPVLQVMSPKVVVEAQPNHIVDCCQWSSMAYNLENMAL